MCCFLCVAGIGLLKVFQAAFPSVSVSPLVGPSFGDLQLEDSCLASKIAGWEKVRFVASPAPELHPENPQIWSQGWEYRRESSSALVNFDQAAYVGWHELCECYTSNGWLLDTRRIVVPDSDDWPCVVGKFHKAPNLSSVVVFSLFYDDGSAVSPPDFSINQATKKDMSFLESIGRRFKQRPLTRSRQCQVVLVQSGAIGSELEDEAVRLHIATRRTIRCKWLNAIR